VKFSISPSLFGNRAFDPYADIEQRLATLEAYTAMRGVQAIEATNAGPVTIPESTSFTNILTIPSSELNIPREDSFVVITYTIDLQISGASNSIRGLEGRLNGSLWGGWTPVGVGVVNMPSTTLYSRPDYSDLTSSSLTAVTVALPFRVPMVYIPGATGPYGLVLDVRRDLDGAGGGTVTARNITMSVDVL
jgi:hypothetical protein